MQGRKKKSSSGAFTLVELLVVIAIIALLLAMLMPALSKVRNMAKSTVCKTQLKGLGSAMVLYAEENNGEYVTQDWNPPPPAPQYLNNENYWFARLGPYVGKANGADMYKVNKFFRCPVGQAIKDFRDRDPFSHIGVDLYVQSFYLSSPGIVTIPDKLMNIKSPGKFAMLFDFYPGELALTPDIITSGCIARAKWNLVARDPAHPEYRKKVFRHDNGINVVRADCHVEYVKNPVPPGGMTPGSWKDFWTDYMVSPSSEGWPFAPLAPAP